MPDRLLAVALTLYEKALCPCGCGHHRDEAFDPDLDGWIEAETVTCQYRAAIERKQAEQRQHPESGEPGQLVYAVDTRGSGAQVADRAPTGGGNTHHE